MIVKQDEAIRELKIWSVGRLTTTHGDDFIITPEILNNTFENYKKLGRRLSLDIHHNVSNLSLPLSQRISVGTFSLEMRNNDQELWAVDIIFSDKEYEQKISKGFFGIYISPEFMGLDMSNTPVADLKQAVSLDIERISFTDDPATISAEPIIKLSRIYNKKIFNKEGTKMDDLFKAVLAHLQNSAASTNSILATIKAAMPDGDVTDPEAKVKEPEEEKKSEEECNPMEKKEEAPVVSTPSTNPESTAPTKVEPKPKPEDVKKEDDKKSEDEPSDEVKKEDSKLKKAEEEEDEEVKKESKKILDLVRAKFGKTLADVESSILALSIASDQAKVLSKEVVDNKKVSEEELKVSNLQLAFESGKLSRKAENKIKEFKSMSIDGQKKFLDRAPSLFETVQQPSFTVPVTPEVLEAEKKLSQKRVVIDCLTNDYIKSMQK